MQPVGEDDAYALETANASNSVSVITEPPGLDASYELNGVPAAPPFTWAAGENTLTVTAAGRTVTITVTKN